MKKKFVSQEPQWVFYSNYNPPKDYNWYALRPVLNVETKERVYEKPVPVPFNLSQPHAPDQEHHSNGEYYDPVPGSVWMGHGGCTDFAGGHIDHVNGGYHFHSGPLAGKSFPDKETAYSAYYSTDEGGNIL